MTLRERTLLCLASDTVVPTANGSAARTLGMASAMVPYFSEVIVRSVSSAAAPAGRPAGLRVEHIPKPTGGVARVRHLLAMLTDGALGFRLPTPLADGRAFVQLESPLLYEAARRAGLHRFILNAHNVYQDMAAFPQATLPESVYYTLTSRRQARIERACWRDASHVVFCSTIDRDRAERLLPGVAVKSSIIPNCVDVSAFTPRPAPRFAAGGPVIFVGTIRYAPNFFAVTEICRAIAPALPDLQFWIVGDASTAPSKAPTNVRFLGRVPSTAEPLAAAQVAIAPVRHGSGTRLKLLEYFAAGLPVVCTAKAAEGLDIRDGCEVRRAERPEDFVAAIRALHADAGACATLGAAARKLVERRYDWAAYVPHLLELYGRHADVSGRTS